MNALASLLLVAVIILGVSSRCPSGWTYLQENCYGYGETAMSWPDAQAVCRTRGAKLAEVSSLEENNLLRSMAREKHAQCAWLGGDDLFQEGTWEWTSTSNTFNGFTNWATGEPNNNDGAQDCLLLNSGYDYAWDDGQCNYRGCSFICSRRSSHTGVAVAK